MPEHKMWPLNQTIFAGAFGKKTSSVSTEQRMYSQIADSFGMQSQVNSDSFLFKSYHCLYFFARIFGSASFFYSTDVWVYIKPVDVATLAASTVFYFITSYLNATIELTIHDNGYQAILVNIGLRIFLSYAPLLVFEFSIQFVHG